MTLSPSSESATHLGHYDLIADVFDELDISDLIDTLLLGSSQTHCQIKGYFFLFPLTKAVCLNFCKILSIPFSSSFLITVPLLNTYFL